MSHHVKVACLLAVVLFIASTALAQDATDLDIDSLVVVNVIETELPGGPVGTSGFLSPDGSLLMHTGDQSFCFYSVPDLEQLRCTPHPEDRNPLPDSMVWSPDSRYLAFMDFDFTRTFRDSDIWIVDSTNGRMTNLTEDNSFETPILRPIEGPVPHLDLEPRWVDNTTLAFLRYDYDGEILPAAIYSVSVEGGEPALVRDIPESNGRLDVYIMDWLAGQDQFIFNRANRGDNEYYGLLFANGDEPLVPMLEDTTPEGLAAMTYMMALAPSAEQVLLYDGRRLGRRGVSTTPDESAAMVIDVNTQETILIDPERVVWEAGWAPDGIGMVYTVVSLEDEDTQGLYLTSMAGEPGRLILQGRFGGTTSLSRQPIQWASNNTILVRNESLHLALVELGAE